MVINSSIIVISEKRAAIKIDHKTEVKEAADGAKKQILGALASAQDSVDGALERFRRAAGIGIPDLSAMDRTDLEHTTVTLIQDLTSVQANFQGVRVATNKNLAKIIRAGNSSPIEEDIRNMSRDRARQRPTSNAFQSSTSSFTEEEDTDAGKNAQENQTRASGRIHKRKSYFH